MSIHHAVCCLKAFVPRIRPPKPHCTDRSKPSWLLGWRRLGLRRMGSHPRDGYALFGRRIVRCGLNKIQHGDASNVSLDFGVSDSVRRLCHLERASLSEA